MTKYDKKFIFEVLKSQIMYDITGKNRLENPYNNAAELFWDSVCEGGVMYLNKTKFPDIRGRQPFWIMWPGTYLETVMIHHMFNDIYNDENCSIQEKMGVESPYCYDKVIVEKDDVVIDAGAYIGDWSAVAAQMGGKVYAFEPNQHSADILDLTAKLNDFTMVQEGLGDMVCDKKINDIVCPLGSSINEEIGSVCHVNTIDQFASDNELHIDFIKSDIEGYERFMLQGARKVLIEDQPKLSIRTYHNNNEDAIILPKLINDINPNYKIINRVKTLYAYVE